MHQQPHPHTSPLSETEKETILQLVQQSGYGPHQLQWLLSFFTKPDLPCIVNDAMVLMGLVLAHSETLHGPELAAVYRLHCFICSTRQSLN